MCFMLSYDATGIRGSTVMTLSNSGQIPKAPSLNTTQSGSISAFGSKEGPGPWPHTANRDARDSAMV